MSSADDSPSAAAAPVPTCPVVHGQAFEPMLESTVACPYPWLAKAREDAPVFFDAEHRMWWVTRYEDARAVLRDPVTYSSREAMRYRPITSPDLARVYPDGHPGVHSIIRKDPPEHTRVRRVANRGFTRPIVAAMEPAIRQRCETLIGAFAADGRCDFVTQFATQLPVQTIVDIIGAPMDQDLAFAQWGEDFFAMLDGALPAGPEAEAEMARRAERMLTWLRSFIASRQEDPQDDLTSALLHAPGDDGTPVLSVDEVIAVLNSLLVAGVDTTASFLPQLLRQVLSQPGLWERIKRDRSLIDAVIEEGVRYLVPSRGVRRTTTVEVELGGVTLPAGADLFIALAGAARDPEMFDEPDRFDIDRPTNKQHLSFGKGTHMCIGASLARLEARVTLETIADLLPDVRLAADNEERWSPDLILPRYRTLRLEWDA